MKKTAFLIFCFLLPLLGCDGDKPYFTIDHIRIELFDASSGISWIGLPENTQTSAAEIAIRQTFSLEYVSQATPSSFFTMSAMAQAEPEPGSLGLKSRIISITVTSDYVFNGQPAGTSLNAYVRAFTGPAGQGSVDDLVAAINAPETALFDYEDIPLVISRPPEAGPQKFRVQIVFENGSQAEGESVKINWQ